MNAPSILCIEITRMIYDTFGGCTATRARSHFDSLEFQRSRVNPAKTNNSNEVAIGLNSFEWIMLIEFDASTRTCLWCSPPWNEIMNHFIDLTFPVTVANQSLTAWLLIEIDGIFTPTWRLTQSQLSRIVSNQSSSGSSIIPLPDSNWRFLQRFRFHSCRSPSRCLFYDRCVTRGGRFLTR